MQHRIVLVLVLGCSTPDRDVCVDLTPRTVEVRLRERDGNSSNKLATLGTVERAENVVMSSPGVYDRRTGSDAVETVSGAKELVAYSGALVTLSDTQLKQRIAGAFTTPAASDLRWQTVTATRSIETGDDQICHSHVRAADGRDWHVWETGSQDIRYSVIDPTTGARIVHDGLAETGGSRPLIIAVGTDILIFFVEGAETSNTAAASLKVRKIAQATPTVISSSATVESAVILPGDDNGSVAPYAYDVVVNGSTPVIASRILDTGNAKTRVRTWNVGAMASSGSLTQTSGDNTNGTDVIGFLNHDFSDSQYYLAVGYHAAPSGVRQLSLNRLATNLAGSITVTSLQTEGVATTARLAWRNVAGYVDGSLTAHVLAETGSLFRETSAHKYYYYATRTSAGAIAATARPGFGLGSKPWIVGSDRYVLLTHTSFIQATYFVADPTSGTIYGRAFASVAGAVDNEVDEFDSAAPVSVPNRPSKLPTPQMSGSTATVAALRLRSAPQETIISVTKGGIARGAWTISFTPWTAGGEHQPILAGDVMLMPGGAPREFDGGSIYESGFHLFPDTTYYEDLNTSDIGQFGNGGALITIETITGSLEEGTYFFQFVWEWTDSRGRLHQSAPSVAFSVPTTGTTGLRFRFRRPTGARTGTRFVVYRTTKNAAQSAPYYRATSTAVAAMNSVNGLYFTVDVITSDGTAESGLTSAPTLYTDDGTLENITAPNMRQARVWKDRVMFLLEENRRAFGWSKLIKPDLGLEWGDDFFFELADEYGDLTALAPLGNAFVLFKRDAVYWISGVGPDDTGAGQFSEPIRLEGVPGTERPRSVLVTEEGVWYQAPDGVMWLITPAMQATPIGEPCSDLTAAVVGAVQVRDKRQIRFHTASTTLVYDTMHSKLIGQPVWTTFTGQASLACCMLGADAHYLTTAAVVRKDGTGYQEAGSSYQAVLELTWASLAGLGRYVRTWAVQVIGQAVGAHTLTAVVTSDFGTGTASRSVASSALKAAHGYRTLLKVPRVLQQKTALKLRLQDDSPNTAGFRLEALNLHCGFGPGRPPLPDAHRMT